MKTKNYNDKKLRKSLDQMYATLKSIIKFAELEDQDRKKLYDAMENVFQVGRKTYLKIRENEPDYVG